MKLTKSIKVGFQNRNDTYTGKLGFVISDTSKGVAWDSWRDHKIPVLELANTPVSGFHLNKSVHRESRYSGRDVIRIWDPRGFEFEITPANLIHIMECCTVSQGEIDGQLIYCWEGSTLLLMPITSETYKEAVRVQEEFQYAITSGTVDKSGKSTFVVGNTYIIDRYKNHFVYLGVFSGKNFDGVETPYRGPNYAPVEDREMRVFVENNPGTYTCDLPPRLWDLRFVPLDKKKGKLCTDVEKFDISRFNDMLHRALPFQESLEYVLVGPDILADTAFNLSSFCYFYLVKEIGSSFEIKECWVERDRRKINGKSWSKDPLNGQELLEAVSRAFKLPSWAPTEAFSVEKACADGYQLLLVKSGNSDYFLPKPIKNYSNTYTYHTFNLKLFKKDERFTTTAG